MGVTEDGQIINAAIPDEVYFLTPNQQRTPARLSADTSPSGLDAPDFLRPATSTPPSSPPLSARSSYSNTSGRLTPIDKLPPVERRRREIEDEAGLNMLLSGGRQAPPADIEYDSE